MCRLPGQPHHLLYPEHWRQVSLLSFSVLPGLAKSQHTWHCISEAFIIAFRIIGQCTDRFVVATTTSKAVLLWTLLGPVTVAGALGTPVQTIAIKRYTTETNRGFAFSLFYS